MGPAVTDHPHIQDPADSGWYHCGACGEVFVGPIGLDAPQTCAACGRPLRRSAAAVAAAAVPQAGVQRDLQIRSRRMAGRPVASGQRSTPRAISSAPLAQQVDSNHARPNRKPLWMAALVIFWLFGLVLLVIHMQKRRGTPPAAASQRVRIEDERTPEEIALLRAAMPKCQVVWLDYLRAATPEARAQSVCDGYLLIGAMERYYAQNPLLGLTSVPVQQTMELLRTPQGAAVETVWETPDQQYEVVFFERRGEWRIDWKAHVRYSETDWPLFLAGQGDEIGEFRLFVRERRSEQASADMLSVVFYQPRFGRLGEYGPQSPEILVPRASEEGRRLQIVLARAADRLGAYRSRRSEIDPSGMGRVRVRVRRHEAAGKRTFTIEQVVAGHWLDIDDPGIDPPTGR